VLPRLTVTPALVAAATDRVHLMKGVLDCAQFFRARGLLDATAGKKGAR
jgi:hypothetical protein